MPWACVDPDDPDKFAPPMGGIGAPRKEAENVAVTLDPPLRVICISLRYPRHEYRASDVSVRPALAALQVALSVNDGVTPISGYMDTAINARPDGLGAAAVTGPSA